MRHFEFPLFFFTVRISHYEYWSHSFQTAHIDSSRTAVFLVVLFERPGWWKWPANTWICTFDSLCASDGKKVTSVESSSELKAPLLNCREKVRTFFLKVFLTFRESNNRMRSTFLFKYRKVKSFPTGPVWFLFLLVPDCLCVDSSTRWFHFLFTLWDKRLILGKPTSGSWKSSTFISKSFDFLTDFNPPQTTSPVSRSTRRQAERHRALSVVLLLRISPHLHFIINVKIPNLITLQVDWGFSWGRL